MEADNFNHGVSATLVGASAARHGEFAANDGRDRDDASTNLQAGSETIDGQWRSVDQARVIAADSVKPTATNVAMLATAPMNASSSSHDFSWLESGKNILALIGAATLMVQLLRLIR